MITRSFIKVKMWLSHENFLILDQIFFCVSLCRGLALDSDDDTWSPLDSDDSDSDEADVSAGKDEPNDDEKKHQRCLSKEIPKHKWSVTKAVINRYLTVTFFKKMLQPYHSS